MRQKNCCIIIKKRVFKIGFMKFLKNKFLHKKQGQVVVEYILLIVVVVAVASIMISFVDLGGSDDEGSNFIKYWRNLIRNIAGDMPLDILRIHLF